MICEVLSRRKASNIEVFRDVSYEWEEDTAKYFNVPIQHIIVNPKQPGKIKEFIKKAFPYARIIKRFLWRAGEHKLLQDIHAPMSLFFLMGVEDLSILPKHNTLPIFIDVFTDDSIRRIISQLKDFKLFYVTSRDIFNRIKARSPKINVQYIPMSVSERYYSHNFMNYRVKPIDVIQIGRRNSVLHEYMLRYAGEHRNIDYVYSDNGSNIRNNYISTLRGNLGQILGREEFIRFLASAKVSLLSSPGIDDSRKLNMDDDMTRKEYLTLDYPTARFYESAILGCALIGRYPDNEEFRELNMSRYCPSITSYEQFTQCLEHALAQTPEELYAQNHDFIINSLTSKRAEQIKHDLEDIS